MFKFSALYSRWVAVPMLNSLAYLWTHTFSKCISAVWNANSSVLVSPNAFPTMISITSRALILSLSLSLSLFHTHTHTHTHTHIYLHICIYVYTYIYKYIYLFIHLSIYMVMFLCFWWHIKLLGSFNAKAIVVEEQ